MREDGQSEGGPGMDRPGGQEVMAPDGRGLSAEASFSHVRGKTRRAEIRSVCLCQFALARLPLHFVDVDVDAATRAATVFFTSETRVDFRDLCRALSRELRMRVTLHRLGPRDLARRAGTCGPCGRALCCKSFLSGFPSVSVKSVKQQKFPLTPERSAGMCGRLKCCLAFERGDAACLQAGCGGCGSSNVSAGDVETTPQIPDC
jgi:cell fate regulator YaaT (PSP1 superfamily)